MHDRKRVMELFFTFGKQTDNCDRQNEISLAIFFFSPEKKKVKNISVLEN